jgi:predicted Zn-dependent protease
MIEKQKIFDMAGSLIKASPADDTEVYFREGDYHLTRFANNTIHQNVSLTDATVLIRVAFGRKVGVASSNRLEDAKRALDEACGIARVSADSTTYAGLPRPETPREVNAFDEATAGCDAMSRAERVKNVVDEAKRAGAVAAGALSTSSDQTAVVNSKGIVVHHRGTETRLNVVMMKGGGSGTAERMGWKLSNIDERAAARHVADRTVKTDRPQDIEPGEYAVVLEPEAVGVLMRFLAYAGLNGKACHEKQSFMSGKLGQEVTGRLITVTDDGLDPSGIPIPFDAEGTPKRKVVFIERGVATGMCYDTSTAAAEHTQSTGHALTSNQSFGPIPMNLFLAPGDSSLERMIASTTKGLLVSKFHYANIAEPMKVVVTGMTRFGLFLVRDGKIAHPVKNMRFTQNVLEAFESASALTAERQMMEGLGGAMLVPGMKCESFRFTGKTEF